ncbi:MAG TPA: hypothetical protein VG488_11910, partial [Candidatus Angelobacter sp.]|nr:hypothetical protein [Candidatus Angelobacter sp.]
TTRLLKSVAEGGLEAAIQNSSKGLNGRSSNPSLVEGKVAEGKRTVIAALHAITRSFGEELKEQQEVLALVADILIDLYTMESVWLRTQKLVAKQSDEKSRIPCDIAILYACDASDRIAVNARNLAGVLASKNADSGVWDSSQRLSAQTPIDTVALRQNIADVLISAGRFIW